MAGHGLGRHLDAVRDVVDAASAPAPDVAVPWAALHHLRTLLRADLVVIEGVVLEGVDHDHRRSSFAQVLARDLQVFTVQVDPAASDRFWRVVGRAASDQQLGEAGLPPPRGSPASLAGPRSGELHGYLSQLVATRPAPHGVLLGSIPDGHGREIRLLCLRGRGNDFDERDRLDLRLLLPHLESVYRRGEEDRATRCVTARQAMLLELVRDGYTNAQIATRLKVAEGTVRTHLNNIYLRMGVQSRTEAVSRLFGSHPWGASASGAASPGGRGRSATWPSRAGGS